MMGLEEVTLFPRRLNNGKINTAHAKSVSCEVFVFCYSTSHHKTNIYCLFPFFIHATFSFRISNQRNSMLQAEERKEKTQRFLLNLAF